jgi:spore coat polysaccharide biosynthesis predicted glycosyltransferase SpsG/RimJ/RimL family protein N-acetyltransferase
MKAVIFTEGGKDAGFGHALRCAAIKSAFGEAGIRTELIIQGDPSVARVLGAGRYRSVPWRNGSARKLASGADLALIDSYLAGRKTYREIAAAVEHCLYLDDCARMSYPEGTVINYNAYGPEMKYPGRSGTRYLLGPAYAPLRKEFLVTPVRGIRKSMERALIFFGGADLPGLTLKTLEFLSANYPGMHKTVVIGAANRGSGAIRRLRDGKTRFIYGAGAVKIKRLMLDCDIAFTAGGVTLYELARTGTPAVVFCAAENQKKNVEAMTKAGAGCQARLVSGKIHVPSLRRTLSRLGAFSVRKRMSAAGSALVDGLGAARLAKYARALILEDKILVRRAVPGDLLPVFRLSNEPAVRVCSIDSAKIILARHREWFLEKLRNRSGLFLIAEFGGKFAGQVRFSEEKRTAVLSISVVKKMRGNGAGRIILRKALEYLRTEHPGTARVLAFVKRDNIPSRKLFENGGFEKIGEPRIKGEKLYLYRFSF